MTWNPDAVRVAVHRDLREIVRLYALLPDEAEAQALGRDAGGLDALNLAAPAANLEAWENRYEAAEREGRDTEYAADQTAELHPLLVLATWEDTVRDELGQPTDLKATVERAADYLSRSVDWMLGTDEWGNLNFLGVDALANDLKKCRRMLEDVTNEGTRATLGAPCPTCRKPLELAWGALPELDRWSCRDEECETSLTHADYAQIVTLRYRHAAEWLTAPEIEETYNTPRSTLRRWATEGHVRKRHDANQARKVYSTSDVQARIEKVGQTDA